MQLLSLLALPLVAASYGQSAYPAAAPAYPAAAPAYGAAAYPQPVAAAPMFFPIVNSWGGRRTLNDEFQGPKIRAPISNPFFHPRFHGERHLHRGDYGPHWGSQFPHHHHHGHHHHHDDDFFGGHRHHHHHHIHAHEPTFVGVPQPVPVFAAPAPVPVMYPQQPAYPMPAAAPGGY